MRPTNDTPRQVPLGFDAPGTCVRLAPVLSRDECARAVAALEAGGFVATGREYPPGYRDNDRAILDDPALAARLFDRVRAVLPPAVPGSGPLVGLNPRFRACRYRHGQAFAIHRDGAWAHAGARSRLTLQVYLNDASDFDGGATRFYASRDPGSWVGSVAPRAGSAVLFDHRLWHDGEAVSRGTKYVLRTDVVYRDAPSATDADDATSVLRGHEGYVFAVVASTDGGLLTSSRDATVRRWARHADAWRTVDRTHDHAASVTCLAEDARGRVWSGSRDHAVRARHGAASRVVFRHDGAVLALAPLAGGLVASASADCTLAVLGDDACVARLGGFGGWVWSAAALDAAHLAAGDADGQVCVWNLVTREVVARVATGAAVRALAVRDGVLVAGCDDGTLRFFDATEPRRPVAQASVRVHEGAVTCAAFLPDGRVASGGEDARVCLSTREQPGVVARVHDDFVTSLAVRDSALASASYDGTIRVAAV